MRRILTGAIIVLSSLWLLGYAAIGISNGRDPFIPLFWNSTNYHPAKIDASSRSLSTVDYEHAEIHSGSHYFATTQATVASGATVAYLLYAPHSTKEIHLAFSGTGSAMTDVTLIEGVPATLKGTAKTVYNSNRNSSNTATAKFYDTVTGDPFTGTTIYRVYSGAATQQSRAPMAAQRNQEIILKSGVTYCFWFKSGTNDNLTNLQLEWYEHVPKSN